MNLPALAFVVMVSMIKDAYEEMKRWSNDSKENTETVKRFSKHSTVPTTSQRQHLRCGQVAIVEQGEYVPADMVLLHTSGPEGTCYVETKNLDGETNLKMKTTHPEALRRFPRAE